MLLSQRATHRIVLQQRTQLEASVRKNRQWYGVVAVVSPLLFVTACSDRDGATKATSGLSAGVSGVIEACANYCDRCDGGSWCDAECRETFDPSVVRGTYLSSLLECESCTVEGDDGTCGYQARQSTGPATERGREFCVQYEGMLEACLLWTDEGFDDCEDWTRQVADASLARFDPCFTYPECDDLFECVQRVFKGEKPEEYVPECSWNDDECREPEEVDPRNSCATARDYRCDGPNVCPPGTDTADCEINDPGNRCAKSYNGVCDEPGTCKPGTDEADCEQAPWGNNCEHAYDGVCDEPRRCLLGTDTYDCSLDAPLDAGTDSGTTSEDGGTEGSVETDAAARN